MMDILAAVFAIFSAIGFVFALVFSDEDWSPWIGAISSFILLTGIFFFRYSKDAPKEIRTEQPPQIDTIIEIRSGILDTTYVYRFYKEDKK